MGYYVHVHVSFACDDYEHVAPLAARHAANHDKSGGDAERAARWFLDDLAARVGQLMGPKGGVALWGMIGNYTGVEEFCERLRPFWAELLHAKGGPCDFEHIVVFEEREQTGQAVAYEICFPERDKQSPDSLTIKRHELPFCWNQW